MRKSLSVVKPNDGIFGYSVRIRIPLRLDQPHNLIRTPAAAADLLPAAWIGRLVPVNAGDLEVAAGVVEDLLVSHDFDHGSCEYRVEINNLLPLAKSTSCSDHKVEEATCTEIWYVIHLLLGRDNCI